MSEPAHGEKVYRCNLGHELRVPADTRYISLLVHTPGGESKEYNHCPHCFGAWAVRQFPLQLQDNPELKRER